MIYTTQIDSPIGHLLLAAQDDALVGLWIEGQKYFPDAQKTSWAERGDLPVFGQTRQWLDRYFSGQRPSAHELRLSPAGSAFRQEVWSILCDIPWGHTMTYGDISRVVARNHGLLHMSAQAIGGAVAHNPISIIIPCHRVIGTNGSLTGYAGGVERKLRLLTLEGVDTKRLFMGRRGAASRPD